ncbi:MAG: ligase-associated DNA damage response endonuclease PdeM [Pseudomonadota bacterium]
MNDYTFTLSGISLVARAAGTLWWPDARLLCVSDLHLGKSERQARRNGVLLPPYETQDTLARLEAEIEMTAPRHVICLGDSFDDVAASSALHGEIQDWLARLVAGRDWTWVEGNHDPGPVDVAGSHRSEISIGPLDFRHIAIPEENGEISGHYHPKIRLQTGAVRPCFLIDKARVVLPAFGTYTGGLRCTDAALAALMERDAIAVMTGARALAVPMHGMAAHPRPRRTFRARHKAKIKG